MNYTLKQLQNRVTKMIAEYGDNAHCAAWIYSKEDIHLLDENGDIDYDIQLEDYKLIGEIMEDLGDSDYIYSKIQDHLDEITSEHIKETK